MADEAGIRPGADPRGLARARRRIARNALASVVTVGVLVTGGVAGFDALREDAVHRPVVTPSPDLVTPSPGVSTPTPQAGLPDHGLAFVEGRLIRFTPGGTEVVATLPDREAPGPPALTPSGVVVLTGGPSIGCRLWLVSLDGTVKEIAHDVTGGFAVDPARDLVAYATTEQHSSPPYYTPIIHVVRLPDGTAVSVSRELDYYAAVAGIVDGKVLLGTGDGAYAATGLWNPATNEVRRWTMYGSAAGADVVTGVALLGVGDGDVPILVRFRNGPDDDQGMTPSEIVVNLIYLGLRGIDFSPEGGLLAGFEGSDLVVLDERTGRVANRLALPGGSQAAWAGDDAIFVLDKRRWSSRAMVHRCDLRTEECVTGDVSLGDPGKFGYGVWLVLGSF